MFDINTSLNLNVVANPAGNAYFNADDVDGQFRKIVQWQWQRC